MSKEGIKKCNNKYGAYGSNKGGLRDPAVHVCWGVMISLHYSFQNVTLLFNEGFPYYKLYITKTSTAHLKKILVQDNKENKKNFIKKRKEMKA